MTRPEIRMQMREIPEDERPRERLARSGSAALRDAELLAILFRTGSASKNALALAEEVMSRFQTLRKLARATISELKSVPGIGEAKAVEILAALELGMRLAKFRELDRPKISSANDVADLLMIPFKTAEVEVFKAVLLNTKNEVTNIVDVSTGGLDSTNALPRDVFKLAIREGASAVIICHNHPSGDPEPSRDDIALTKRLADAASILGLRLLDHVIFGDDRHVSLKERNLF